VIHGLNIDRGVGLFHFYGVRPEPS
jgi:hypothetical protein